tara:strand:- start:42 stop:455 length:414 start_codon:yes stop_codon:yes gene_type:complete
VLCSVGGERLAFTHRTREAVDSIRIANRAEITTVALGAAGEDVGDGVEGTILARSFARRWGETPERAERAHCENSSLRFTATSGGATRAGVVGIAVVTFGRREKERRRRRDVRVGAEGTVAGERRTKPYLDHIPPPL